MSTTLITPSTSIAPSRPKLTPRQVRRRVGRGVLLFVMILVAGVMLYPFVVMLVTSFKTESQYLIGHGSSCLLYTSPNDVICATRSP